MAVLAIVSPLFAQTDVATKVFVINSGKFEMAMPYTDFVAVGAYDVLNGSYHTIDTINAQAAQTATIYKQKLYVAAENNLSSYDAATTTKTATAAYPGVSPHAIAANDNYVVVGNWYGHTDSGLYIYNTAMALQHITKGITKDVKAIALDNQTAYIAQNIPGTIDGCAPWGCYTDSIGYIVKVDLATNSILDTLLIDTAIAGINSLFIENGKLVGVANVAAKIIVYDLTTNMAAVYAENNLKKGLSLSNNQLAIVTNSDQVVYYNITNQTKTIRNNAATPMAVATAADKNSSLVFQTISDYTTYGSLRVFDGVAKDDTIAVGISPENLVVYYDRAFPVIANDDAYAFAFNIDTLLPVKENDIDSNTLPVVVSIVSGPKVIGATATVAGDMIHYTPAIGLIINDTLQYSLCNAAGQCDTATVYLQLKGVTNTAVEEIAVAVSVYPNPFDKMITIAAAEKIATIAMIAMDGKVISVEKIDSYQHQLNTAALASGIYFINIQTIAGNKKVVKLMK